MFRYNKILLHSDWLTLFCDFMLLAKYLRRPIGHLNISRRRRLQHLKAVCFSKITNRLKQDIEGKMLVAAYARLCGGGAKVVLPRAGRTGKTNRLKGAGASRAY